MTIMYIALILLHIYDNFYLTTLTTLRRMLYVCVQNRGCPKKTGHMRRSISLENFYFHKYL